MIPKPLCCLLAVLALADGFMAPLRVKCKARQIGGGPTRMGADVPEEPYLTWLTKKVDRARRPKFVSIARARMQKDFAVLLMRSSYQVQAQRKSEYGWVEPPHVSLLNLFQCSCFEELDVLFINAPAPSRLSCRSLMILTSFQWTSSRSSSSSCGRASGRPTKRTSREGEERAR